MAQDLTPPQQTIPQLVPLQGVPTGWRADAPALGIVVLLLSTPVGTSIYHFTDRDIDKLCETLRAAQARSRIIVKTNPN